MNLLPDSSDAIADDDNTSVLEVGQQPPTPDTAAVFQAPAPAPPMAGPSAPTTALAPEHPFGGLSDDQIATLLGGLYADGGQADADADLALLVTSSGGQAGSSPAEAPEATDGLTPAPPSRKRKTTSPKQHNSSAAPVRKRNRQPFALSANEQKRVVEVMRMAYPHCMFTRPTFVDEWLKAIQAAPTLDLPGSLRALLDNAVEHLRACQIGELLCLVCWAMISCDYRHIVQRVMQDAEEERDPDTQRKVLRQLRMYAAGCGNFMRSSVVGRKDALSLLPCFRETLVPRRDFSIYPPSVRLPDLFEEPRVVRFGWVNPIC